MARRPRTKGWSLCALGPLTLCLLVFAGCDQGAASASARLETPEPPRIASLAGDQALDFVSDQRYPALWLEVDAVGSASPLPDALVAVREVLGQRVAKPAGIGPDPTVAPVVDDRVARAPSPEPWTAPLVAQVEVLHRDHWTGAATDPDRAAIWIVYLPGLWEPEEGEDPPLALAIGGSEIAVFPDRIDEAVGELGPAARLQVETLVVLHEIGHLLGLVNNGVPSLTVHEDPQHRFHDQDPGCVMHYRIEDGWLRQKVAVDFGYRCRLDLFNVGGPDPGAPESDVPN